MNTSRAVIALAILVPLSCKSSTSPYGAGGGGGGGGPLPNSIGVADYAFGPESLTVTAGTVVQWINAGPSTHTVTSDASAWTSTTLVPPSGSNPYGGMSGGGTFQFNFSSPGTYHYHCSIHASMHGVVVVTP